MPFAIQTLLRLYGHIFSCFGRIAFKIDDSTYFKALFPAVSIDIRVLLFIKIWKKNCGRVYSCRLSHSLYSNDKECCKLRAVSLCFLVRRAKRTKYSNDHAREWRPPLFLAASTLARARVTLLTNLKKKRECSHSKGDVTRDDSQRRFLAQHSVATLFRIVTTLFQHCNVVLR